MATHRIAPLPPWINNPRPNCCKWCNTPVWGRRRCWHQECKLLYELTGKGVRDWRWAYYEWRGWSKTHGHCEKCKCRLWVNMCELDHIEPLIISHDRGISAWMPANLQALCHDCHAAKTKEDMANLRSIRRAERTYGLFQEATDG